MPNDEHNDEDEANSRTKTNGDSRLNDDVNTAFPPLFGRGIRGMGRGRRHVGGIGPGMGPGMGRGRRGRPPVAYSIDFPRENVGRTVLQLTSFEFHILQMADLEGLTQTQIATELNISQTSVWRYLKGVRSKVATALVNSNIIELEIIDI